MGERVREAKKRRREGGRKERGCEKREEWSKRERD